MMSICFEVKYDVKSELVVFCWSSKLNFDKRLMELLDSKFKHVSVMLICL